jgi:hypothetical protein
VPDRSKNCRSGEGHCRGIVARETIPCERHQGKTAESDACSLQSRDAMGVYKPEPNHIRTSIGLGWHALRHTFGTLVKSQGADVATTQALMRHANASITMDRYVQAVTPAKREAQSRIVKSIPFPFVPTTLTGAVANA